MKRFLVLFLALGLSAGLLARDDGGHDGGGRQDDGGGGEHHETNEKPAASHAAAPHHVQKTVRSSQGGSSRQNQGHGTRNSQGHSNNGAPQYHAQHNSAAVRSSHSAGGNARVQAHFQQRVSSQGISHGPKPISNRSHILSTSRAQSVIGMPRTGFDGHAIASVSIGAHDWNKPLVRTQMNLVINDHARISAIGHLTLVENQRDHYSWHHDSGFDYCHYYDPWGYHWYGWYLGSSYFWTRYYSDRWWFYDTAFDRWCFYNGGGWWWQDPAAGSLYVYDDGQYVPSDGGDAGDQGASPAPAPAAASNPSVFRSNDDSRMVKIMGGSQDAFLYDTAIPPAFSPLYLASGAQSVKFSDTSNGKPLQIMVTLSDGTFDIFDAQGESMNFSDGKPGNESQAPSGPPQGGSPPPPRN